MNIKYKLLAMPLLTMLLVACGNDEEIEPSFTSPVPLEFNAGITDAVSTRVSGTSWQTNDQIGVSFSGSTTAENKLYTVSNTSTGSFSSNDKLYFQNSGDANFYAYYPYSSSDVTIDASTEYGRSESEKYLFASWICNYKNYTNTTVTFKHIMSKLTLTFSPGDGMNGSFGSDFSYSFRNTIYTKGTLDKKGGFSSMEKETITLPDLDRNKTASLLVLPQTLTSDGITIYVTNAGVTYSTTLLGNSTLESSTNYQFTITVSKTGLTISKSNITGWTDDTNTTTAGSTLGSITNPSEVKQYDLAMSDGSFARVLNGSTVDLSGIDKDEVVGIVYWLGNPCDEDAILKRDYPNCTHGLIVALSDVSSDYVIWQGYIGEDDEGNDEYCDMEMISSNYTTSDGYSLIALKWDYNSTNPTDLNKISGYTNTYVLRHYNKERAIGNMSGYEVKPITAIDNYATAAPKGSSGWFLPSPKELVLLANGTTTIRYGNQNNGSTKTVAETVGKILTALKGETTSLSNWYWSSSEYAGHYYRAYYVNFDGSSYGSVNYDDKVDSDYVRAVSAF